uniref:Epoxyqueuosine reductase n=1 Tax=Tetraselmis sp. GSL018 TaxID=582737 RepID=A0A061S2M7_9CHLO|mmetsp:Transcript_30835/g.73440  ORF Transcript_30835/g.73440 Transcript_30835/m.73440 type:complete len:304 (-) Transcript_30835:422-1333(-)
MAPDLASDFHDMSLQATKGIQEKKALAAVDSTHDVPEEVCLRPRREPPKPPNGATKVLLHSCCAPCSGAMVHEMRKSGLDITIFFYNPNIHPRKEYELRKAENVRYAKKLGIPFVDADYDADNWFERAKGLEHSPERGARCTMCFDMRMDRTALYAKEHGFEVFTTTNATSRWKDINQVNASGIQAAQKYPGIEYWVYDWQTQEMTDLKYQINAKEEFYKQEYCGCAFSLRDSNAWRKKQGMKPIQIGKGGNFGDAEFDAEEENQEVVHSFFEQFPPHDRPTERINGLISTHSHPEKPAALEW